MRMLDEDDTVKVGLFNSVSRRHRVSRIHRIWQAKPLGNSGFPRLATKRQSRHLSCRPERPSRARHLPSILSTRKSQSSWVLWPNFLIVNHHSRTYYTKYALAYFVSVGDLMYLVACDDFRRPARANRALTVRGRVQDADGRSCGWVQRPRLCKSLRVTETHCLRCVP